MSALVHRPTENAAIGRVMNAKPARVHIGQLLLDRAAARTRLDRYGDWLLGHRIAQALAGGKLGA